MLASTMAHLGQKMRPERHLKRRRSPSLCEFDQSDPPCSSGHQLAGWHGTRIPESKAIFSSHDPALRITTPFVVPRYMRMLTTVFVLAAHCGAANELPDSLISGLARPRSDDRKLQLFSSRSVEGNEDAIRRSTRALQVPSVCSLCPQGSIMGSPDQPVEIPPGFPPVAKNCKELNDLLASLSLDVSSPQCVTVRSIGENCECTVNATPDETSEAKDPPINVTNSTAPAEADMQSTATSTSTESPSASSSCVFCPKDETLPFPNRTLTIPVRDKSLSFPVDANAEVSCAQINAAAGLMPAESTECFIAQKINYICGCNNGEREYLGADTETKRAVLAWLPRVSAIISLLSSLLIIRDILRRYRQSAVGSSLRAGSSQNRVYLELLLGMSVADMVGSVAWSFTTLPIPEYLPNGYPSQIYGAHGNEQTCAAQGFFVQLGYIGVFYNMMLSVYYVLVIRFGYKGQRLLKVRKWLHAIPLSIGVILAFAAIPFYDMAVWGCHIAPPPLESNYGPILVFSVIPLSLVITVATVNMVLVYLKVRRVGKAARKWTFNGRTKEFRRPNAGTPSAGPERPAVLASVIESKDSSLDLSSDAFDAACRTAAQADLEGSCRDSERKSFSTSGLANTARRFSRRLSVRQQEDKGALDRSQRAVFWQSLTYLAAFYVSWPLYMAGNLDRMADHYGFYLTVFVMAPLQGFWNAIVYFRARPRERKVRSEAAHSDQGAKSWRYNLFARFGNSDISRENKQSSRSSPRGKSSSLLSSCAVIPEETTESPKYKQTETGDSDLPVPLPGPSRSGHTFPASMSFDSDVCSIEKTSSEASNSGADENKEERHSSTPTQRCRGRQNEESLSIPSGGNVADSNAADELKYSGEEYAHLSA